MKKLQITNFNSKETRTAIQMSMELALQKVAAEYGLESITFAGSMYDSLDCTYKFKAKCSSTTPIALLKNLQDSRYLGFNTNIVGESFIDKRKKFTITGISTNRKASVDCLREDGKEFGFYPSHLKTGALSHLVK